MIKLFVAIFVEKNEDENVQKEYDEMKKNPAQYKRNETFDYALSEVLADA